MSFIVTCVMSFLMMIDSGTKDLLRTMGVMLIVVAAYFLHEMAHKISAQIRGYWAEYRLDLIGIVMTIVSFLFPIKLIVSGHVKIIGKTMFLDDYGKIALAGPAVNIAQAALFGIVIAISSESLLRSFCVFGFTFNSALALMNLFPIGRLDGSHVLKWDWKTWLFFITVAGVLLVYAFFL